MCQALSCFIELLNCNRLENSNLKILEEIVTLKLILLWLTRQRIQCSLRNKVWMEKKQ